jgi:hypothetical protein
MPIDSFCHDGSTMADSSTTQWETFLFRRPSLWRPLIIGRPACHPVLLTYKICIKSSPLPPRKLDRTCSPHSLNSSTKLSAPKRIPRVISSQYCLEPLQPGTICLPIHPQHVLLTAQSKGSRDSFPRIAFSDKPFSTS